MRAMFIGLLFTSAVVLAQTPGKVGYQGRLSNADGTPAQGVVQMRFELFAAASGGTALWGETQTIALSDGLYSTFLGEVTALPDTVFDGSERFLELTVGTTTLSPRQRVASVPYALVARDPRLLVSCADGEVLKWSTTNSRWACAPDDGTSASTLANYVTIASLTSTLSGYPTNASLTTTLAGYPTNASLTTALAGYVTSSELTTTLSGYPTNASLTTTLAGYVTSSELTTTLAGYPTNASLTTTLSSYPTNMALATALSGYVSTSDLSTALASYPTNASLTATLAGYVSTTALDARLSSYALASSLPTSVDGLAGGTITSAVTVSGALGATSLTQNGNAVCDVSGNCGATLGAFNPASACSQNQVLQWTGTAWGCTTIGGSTPSQPCTGAGQALQWDGTTWTCINVQNSGLSGGRANGFETRDDWGDVWDGVPRAARTWAEANQACSSAGARLPTVTELWRNRATYGTGNIGTPNDTYPLWTIAPSYRPNYYATTVLSNGAFTDVLATNSVAFRCIWKSQSPSGLSGNRCFGPPGAECRAKDAFYNVDRWSRAPQFFPSAKKECELENASIATAEDLEAELSRGANFVSTPDLAWPAWHFTASSSAYSNGYLYSRLLRWTKNPEPWWGPDSTSANFGAPTSVYTFRCVGKKTAGSGVRPASPACQGSCFEITGPSRNRLIADNADRPAAVWHVAFKACQAVGGTLPTMEEINQLVHAGWGNGVITRYLWSGSPATWGWQVARWDGTGSGYWNPHHDYSNAQYSGTFVQPATATQYRCVWREARAASFLTCPANAVQLEDPVTGVSSCVNAVAGNSNGQQNPSNLPPFVDAWGNAFDLFERASATWANAKATCEAAGGRLPLATELFRVRYAQGVVPTELGQSGTATQNYLWTLNHDYRETYRTQLRLSDGSATAADVGNTASYRCVWPATAPTAFSGHACYGHPSAPCFTTGRLRTDTYPRASLPQPAAQWECRQLGGRLPSVRELAELQEASLPNSLAFEWSREWATWSDGNTYGYLGGRGNNATRANWQFDQTQNEASWNTEQSYLRFRCVYTDYMD